MNQVLFNQNEAGRYLGMTGRNFKNHLDKGEFTPYVKGIQVAGMTKYSKEDLDAYIEAKRNAA